MLQREGKTHNSIKDNDEFPYEITCEAVKAGGKKARNYFLVLTLSLVSCGTCSESFSLSRPHFLFLKSEENRLDESVSLFLFLKSVTIQFGELYDTKFSGQQCRMVPKNGSSFHPFFSFLKQKIIENVLMPANLCPMLCAHKWRQTYSILTKDTI